MGLCFVVRWFTAHRIAKFEAPAGWCFEPGGYLGIDRHGVLRKRSDSRPSDAVIIHDLGHALLAPPGLISFGAPPVALDRPGALRAFLLGQRQLGKIALSQAVLAQGGVDLQARLDDSSLPSLLDLTQPAQLTRRLVPQDTQGETKLVGALEEGDLLDLAVWDLDAPQLAGLPEPDACEQIWSGLAGPSVKEIWLAGQLLT